MKTALLAGLLALTIAPTTASAASWAIDTGHSEVGFKVRHMMVSDARGRFAKFGGTVDWDGKDLSKAKVSVTIDMASVDTGDEKRDGHLRGADFFDAAKHPQMKFESTAVKSSGDKLTMTGNLTLRGVTKPVTLTLDGPRGPVVGPWGKTRTGFSASGKISRKDFGVSWSKSMDKGGVVVADEVRIQLEIELIKQ